MCATFHANIKSLEAGMVLESTHNPAETTVTDKIFSHEQKWKTAFHSKEYFTKSNPPAAT